MRVPFVDLVNQAAEIEEEVFDSLRDLVGRGQFAGGPFVEAFERDFASYCNVGYCVGLGSGTAAIEELLRALELGQGDEVIIPANTFIAAAEAIVRAGVTPVLVDVDESANVDVAIVEQAISSHTKAVLATHLYGQPAAMDHLIEICSRANLMLLEDAAQAQGARWNGKPVGSLGHAATFSFYPSKNLGAWGEAGCVVTNDKGLADRIRSLRNHGSETRYRHDLLGTNQRMDGMQAAVLSVGLRRLNAWNDRRRQVGRRYRALLANAPVQFIKEEPSAEQIYHLMVVRVPNRDDVAARLSEKGVATGIHYPIPIHLQPAFENLGYFKGDFPTAEQLAGEILSLPMFPQITDEQVDYTAQSLLECLIE